MSRIQDLKNARTPAHILKLELHRIQENDFVFFYEGIEDVEFYETKIKPIIDYKSLKHSYRICKGKKNILNLINDKNLPHKEKCLFFIDKDFDDFLGNKHPKNDNLFITEGYSFENYLVNETILSLFLKETSILEIAYFTDKFKQAYQEFSDLLRPMLEDALHHRKQNGEKFSFPETHPFYDVTEDYQVQKTSKIPAFPCVHDKNSLFKNVPICLWLRGKDALVFMRKFCGLIEKNLKIKHKYTNDERKFLLKLISITPIPPDLKQFLQDHFEPSIPT